MLLTFITPSPYRNGQKRHKGQARQTRCRNAMTRGPRVPRVLGIIALPFTIEITNIIEEMLSPRAPFFACIYVISLTRYIDSKIDGQFR